MKMCILFLLLAYLVASGSANFLKSPSTLPKAKDVSSVVRKGGPAANPLNIGSQEASDMFNCFCVISCYWKEVHVLVTLFGRLGPILRHEGLMTYASCYDAKVTETEMFRDWDTIVCPQEIKKKRDAMVHTMAHMGDKIKDMCENAPFNLTCAEECEKVHVTVAEAMKIVEDYTRREKCYNKDTMPKEMAKDFQEMAEANG